MKRATWPMTFDLPPGAERLAATALTPKGAFALGNAALER